MTIDGVSPGCELDEALAVLGPASKKEPILDDDLTVYTYPNSLSLVVGPNNVVREIHGGAVLATSDGSVVRLKMSQDDIMEILGAPTVTRMGDYCTFEVDDIGEFVPHPLSPGPISPGIATRRSRTSSARTQTACSKTDQSPRPHFIR